MDLIIRVIGYVLMVIGVIGYSFRPPPDYIGREERMLTTLCLYYSILALILFTDVVWHWSGIQGFELFEIAFMIALLCIALYGIVTLKNVWKFEIVKVRDALLYGSVVFLMDVHIHTPARYEIPIMSVALALSAWVAIMSAYVILKFRKLRFFLTFERFELVSIAFFTVFLVGLSTAWSNITETLPFLLTIILTAYALYVIIAEFIRPLIQG